MPLNNCIEGEIIMEEFAEGFEFIMRMVMEATVLKKRSYSVLRAEDEYERYILKANWYEDKPTLYIIYDNVYGDRYIYYEVKEINRTEIFHLLEVWNEIVSRFEEE